MGKMEREKNRENFEDISVTFKGNHKNLDFLKLDIQNLEEMKGYLNLFMKGWKKFYPAQCETHVDTNACTKNYQKWRPLNYLKRRLQNNLTL